VDVLFAGVATSDFSAALVWYETLMGRPHDLVAHDTEVMWRVNDGGWLYLVVDAERAGHALVALTVPDLEQALADLAGRGVDPPDVEVIGAARKATIIDPEGNRIAFIEVPTSSE